MAGGLSKSREVDLIRRARAGERDAAAELIRVHQQPVYVYILRLCGRPHLAEDVVQEAFARALTNLDRFDPTYRFSTWLFTIARRVLFDTRPGFGMQVDDAVLEMIRGDASGGGGPLAVALAADEHAATEDLIRRALGALPLVQRELVILCHQMGWPVDAAARHLDLPEGTVKSHLHRARARLRAWLEREERIRLRQSPALEPRLKPSHQPGTPPDPRGPRRGSGRADGEVRS